MGYPMARNLLRAGHQVAVWSNTTEKARKLAAAEKGQFCETPKQVAENADCIFLCLAIPKWRRRFCWGRRASFRVYTREPWLPIAAPSAPT